VAPADLPVGSQVMIAANAGGPFATYTVNVAPSAPSIFFYPAPAILKNVDFSPVSAANPAKAGDVVLVYCTGLSSGPVTATVDAKSATVIYALPSPGFFGLEQVAITVPAGVSGSVPVVLQQDGVVSNSVALPVK
jgi:uncharacterized protein (TIGR03437 family)